jgi:hypothetical protein
MRRNIVGFHINVWNMPRIGDYKHAKEIFNSKTVVRGENQAVRRLGDRYEKEKWLRQEILDGIEVYVAGYYDTGLVRFYPTHREITLGNYPSLSTQYFVERIGGVNLQPFEHKRYVPAPFTRSPMVKNHQIECYVCLKGEWWHMNANDWYKISYQNEPLEPEQFEKPVKYKFDASQMRELRLPYKKLLKYADTMLKLNNNTGVDGDEELNKQLPEHCTNENILKLCADEDKTYLAYYYALRHCQRSIWKGWNGNGNNYEYNCNIGIFKRWLDKMIKLENPQVLVEVC